LTRTDALLNFKRPKIYVSGILCLVDWQNIIGVSEGLAVSILKLGYSKNGSSKFLRNVNYNLSIYKLSYPRRLGSLSAQL
jgi:hypothetical protein